MKILGRLKEIFSPSVEHAAGIYHYRQEFDGKFQRLHLRVDSDGSGLLIVNASGVLHLNATAVTLIKSILEGKSKEQTVKQLLKEYKTTRKVILEDFEKIQSIISTLNTAEDVCPIWRLDVEDVKPFEKKVKAPYRADLALTYACNNKCMHCYVSRKADEKTPLGTEEWKKVLSRLWEVGVPHICFTGGEATVSPCLVDLIEYAEDIGQITGLLTNGRRLSDPVFMRRLCDAGLDHVQITIESHDESVHDRMVGHEGAFRETVQGIRNAVENDVYLVTNTTLCNLNIENIEETIGFIKQLGVRQFAMNSFIQTGSAPASGEGLAEDQIEQVVGRVMAGADAAGMRFIWYTPTRYCEFNPGMYGIGLKRCTAAEYNICVEPDGDVIPCQSYYEPAGNILRDPWEKIWDGPLFTQIRMRTQAAESCRACPDFTVCGGGCPLSKGDRFLCSDSSSEM